MLSATSQGAVTDADQGPNDGQIDGGPQGTGRVDSKRARPVGVVVLGRQIE